MNENNYGNFEEKEAYRTIRKTDVLLESLNKCQALAEELELAARRIGELTKELEFEKDRREDLEYENRRLRSELQSMECRG